MTRLTTIAFAFAAACLAGCATRPGFDRPLDTTATNEVARTFQCMQRGLDGKCIANRCTAGPGGLEYDCASFAAACVNAGYHWSGTRDGGTCSVIL